MLLRKQRPPFPGKIIIRENHFNPVRLSSTPTHHIAHLPVHDRWFAIFRKPILSTHDGCVLCTCSWVQQAQTNGCLSVDSNIKPTFWWRRTDARKPPSFWFWPRQRCRRRPFHHIPKRRHQHALCSASTTNNLTHYLLFNLSNWCFEGDPYRRGRTTQHSGHEFLLY